jgi:hypothetical protein
MARSGSSVGFLLFPADVDMFIESDVWLGRPCESSNDDGRQKLIASAFSLHAALDLDLDLTARLLWGSHAAAPASNRGALTPDVDLDIFMSTFAPQTRAHPQVLNSYRNQQTGTSFPASPSQA